MKPTTNIFDEQKLAWLIDLLNEGRSPEPPLADRRKPANEKKRTKKRIDWLRLEASPDGLRAGAGRLMGAMLLNLFGMNTSPEALRSANEVAKQCLSSPQFARDRSGKLRVYRAAQPGSRLDAPLLIDAMGILSYLVDCGLHSRLKSCLGFRAPRYRGDTARRCNLWFNGASNKTFCSIACRKRAERKRNNEDYKARQREFMREKREEEKKEDATRAKEGRSKWKHRVISERRPSSARALEKVKPRIGHRKNGGERA